MKLNFLTLTFFLFYFSLHAQNDLEIKKILEDHKSDFNGHALMLVKNKDSIIFSHQMGLAKIDTKVGMASASKWISASVILSLVDQGYLSLDDSIGKYLPMFSKYGKGKPTIRQCLTHTSGFPAFSNLDYKDLTLTMLVDSMAKYVPLKKQPGEVFEYGEMSFRIVGSIAEKVTGKNWEEIFQNNIASKCKMINTNYCWEKNNPALGSGVCTSASDYLNFLEMVINKGKYQGEQVLSESSVLEFYKSQLTPNAQKYLIKSNPHIKEMTDGKPISYGLGTWIYNYKMEEKYQKEIFCPGALGTFPFIDSCKGIFGIIITNTKIEKVVSTELKVISIIKDNFKMNCK